VKTGQAVVAFVLVLGIAASGIAIGYGFGDSLFTPPAARTVTVTASSSAGSNSSAPFDLTLVITTNNTYNSTVGSQPAFYVLGPNGLESSANIALPAHRLIRLEIICYDDGSANLTTSSAATVSGTQNGTITIVNNDNVNSSQGAAAIQLSGGQTVSSVPANDTAHTFTIPSIGLNIPVEPSSTVIAYFTITKTGTFTWICQTLCGSGPTGLLGAMATPGWMYGNIDSS
jgi:plastocyanin